MATVTLLSLLSTTQQAANPTSEVAGFKDVLSQAEANQTSITATLNSEVSSTKSTTSLQSSAPPPQASAPPPDTGAPKIGSAPPPETKAGSSGEAANLGPNAQSQKPDPHTNPKANISTSDQLVSEPAVSTSLAENAGPLTKKSGRTSADLANAANKPSQPTTLAVTAQLGLVRAAQMPWPTVTNPSLQSMALAVSFASSPASQTGIACQSGSSALQNSPTVGVDTSRLSSTNGAELPESVPAAGSSTLLAAVGVDATHGFDQAQSNLKMPRLVGASPQPSGLEDAQGATSKAQASPVKSLASSTASAVSEGLAIKVSSNKAVLSGSSPTGVTASTETHEQTPKAIKASETTGLQDGASPSSVTTAQVSQSGNLPSDTGTAGLVQVTKALAHPTSASESASKPESRTAPSTQDLTVASNSSTSSKSGPAGAVNSGPQGEQLHSQQSNSQSSTADHSNRESSNSSGSNSKSSSGDQTDPGQPSQFNTTPEKSGQASTFQLDAQAEAVKSKASSVNSLQSRNDSTAGSDAVTGKDGGVEALNPGANGGLNGGNPAVTPSSTNKESEVSASARSTSSKKGGVTMSPDSSNQGSPITSTVDAPGGKPVLSAMSQGTLDSTTRLNAVKQVADRLQVMAATRPQNAVTIELTPAGLGTVSVTVKGIGKTIIADLAASNDAVRAALSEGRNTLTQAMEQKGFTVSELNVRTHVAASQAGAGMSNANQGRQDQPSSQNQQWTGQASSQTPGFNAQGQAFAHSQNSRQGGSGSRFQAGQDQDLTPQASKASASASLDLSI